MMTSNCMGSPNKLGDASLDVVCVDEGVGVGFQVLRPGPARLLAGAAV
jgi:hypothetical protein